MFCMHVSSFSGGPYEGLTCLPCFALSISPVGVDRVVLHRVQSG